MDGGDAFRLIGVADRHTWVILSDPLQDSHHVLIVSFTSYSAGIDMDDSCVVEPDEFSILTNKSCIYYEDMKEASVASLEAIRKAGRLQMRAPVSKALLQRIRSGAIVSDDCKEKYKEFLKTQRLVDSNR
ncbi:MAG: hypothetical protein ACHRXM_08535 [Isosphaerales bacterium]